MRLLFISTVIGSWLFEAIRDIDDDRIQLDVIYPNDITEERVPEYEVREKIDKADAIVIDIRGGGRAEELVYNCLKDKDKTVITLLGSERLFSLTKLGAFSMKNFQKKREVSEGMRSPIAVYERIKTVQKIIEIAGKILPFGILKDARNYVMLLKYWGFGCKENYKNLILLLGRYHGIEGGGIKPPLELEEYGIYHPELGIFTDIESYLRASGKIEEIYSKPNIGILFTGGSHFQQNIPLINSLIYEFREFNVIP
ncbi:MAG: cobaltochelatase subunit CobN, partial [Thermodesulfovibrionales bacterium]|nr:cobaltochelatase subunit CobN [Thermodesulfovibrionales bacterium]